MEGWVKLHRKLLTSQIFQNEKLLQIWIWCLLKASYQDFSQLVGLQNIELKPGQFIFGRKKAAEELKMNENTFYSNIKFIENLRTYQHQF